MSRSDAFIRVMCDKCQIEEEIELCALSGKGSWDERYIDKHLKRDGWVTIDGQDLCDECRPPSAEELASARTSAAEPK
jgi:hypothetical protein